ACAWSHARPGGAAVGIPHGHPGGAVMGDAAMGNAVKDPPLSSPASGKQALVTGPAPDAPPLPATAILLSGTPPTGGDQIRVATAFITPAASRISDGTGRGRVAAPEASALSAWRASSAFICSRMRR